MIRIETRGVFVHATLDAPATHNALTGEMVDSLGEALDLAADAFARALRSGTATEGLLAFTEKRPARWVPRGGEG